MMESGGKYIIAVLWFNPTGSKLDIRGKGGASGDMIFHAEPINPVNRIYGWRYRCKQSFN